MDDNKYKKLLSNTVLFGVSNFGSKVLVFFLVPLYTNILSTQEYGVVDIITTMTSLLVPVLTLLIGEATLRFALEEGSDKHKILSCANTLVFCSALIMLLAKPLVSKLGGEWAVIGEYWHWVLSVYFLTAFNTCLNSYARGTDKTGLFAISGILYTVVLIAANLVYLLVLGMGTKGYLLAIITAEGVCIAHKLVFGKIYRELLPIRLDRSVFSEMLRYSIPMIPSTVAWWVMQLSDKYVIIGCFGIAASGIYSIAYKIPGVLSAVTNVFTQAWQISAVKSYKDQDNETFVSNVIAGVTALSVLISTILIAIVKPLGRLIYAKEYFVAWTYVPILIVAYHFSGLSGVLASLYSATKKTGMLFISTLVGAVLNIILNLLLIPRFGVICAAYTTMVAFFVTWLVRVIHVRKLVRFRMNVFRLGLSLALLITQAILVSQDLAQSYITSAVILVIQLVLFGDMLWKIVIGVVGMVRKQFGKGEEK